jgi:hypothetical protein
LTNIVDELFPTELKDRLEQIRDADIVVGIPSYNNARTIGHVVRAVSVGLAKYFPTQRSVIVNSDGGSMTCCWYPTPSTTATVSALRTMAFPEKGAPSGRFSRSRSI